MVHLERYILKQVRPKDRASVVVDFKDVFRVGDRYDTTDKGWERWRSFCKKWGEYYKGIKKMGENDRYRLYFTYLSYDYRIHNMIYTTNWIERLNRAYKRTTRIRGALLNPEATILLFGYVAMTRDEYQRKLPKLNYETRKFRWSE